MGQVFSNNASALLAEQLDVVGTVITVQPGKGALFPSVVDPDYAVLTITQSIGGESSWEEVRLMSRVGDELTVVRAQEGTIASMWPTASLVELRITAAMLNGVGYKAIPQTAKSANYTCELSDSGNHILHPSADATARTFTIPSNATVPFPVGTAITFVNQNGAGMVTIAIQSDTMRLSVAGSTGNRSLAANGIATAIKLTQTEWLISGAGLS